jgi:hypothetical protein
LDDVNDDVDIDHAIVFSPKKMIKEKARKDAGKRLIRVAVNSNSKPKPISPPSDQVGSGYQNEPDSFIDQLETDFDEMHEQQKRCRLIVDTITSTCSDLVGLIPENGTLSLVRALVPH